MLETETHGPQKKIPVVQPEEDEDKSRLDGDNRDSGVSHTGSIEEEDAAAATEEEDAAASTGDEDAAAETEDEVSMQENKISMWSLRCPTEGPLTHCPNSLCYQTKSS